MLPKLLILLICFLFGFSCYAEDSFLALYRSVSCEQISIQVFRSGYVYVGKTTCGHKSNPGYHRLFKITDEQIKSIDQAMSAAKLSTLIKSIEPVEYPEKCEQLTISVPEVYEGYPFRSWWAYCGLDLAKDHQARKRFQLVWNTVLEVLPEKQY